MKLFKKKLGFSLVELVIAVGLLGAVSVGTGLYISNSFKDSNKLANKADVQNSVTALMNKIETEVKMADIPVLVDGFTNNNFTITKPDSAGTNFVLSGNVVTAGVNRYENIKSINIALVAEKRGIEIEIIGQDDLYKLSGSYYTRNTQSSSTPIGGPASYYCACIACSNSVSNSGEYCSNCTSSTCSTCGECINCCDCHSVPEPVPTYDCACGSCNTTVNASGEYCSECISACSGGCGNCDKHCTCDGPIVYDCACGSCNTVVSRSGEYCSECISACSGGCGNCDKHCTCDEPIVYECACGSCNTVVSRSGEYCSECISACSGGCGNCDKHCTCDEPVRLTYIENADGVTNMPTPRSQEYNKGDSITISGTIPEKQYHTFKDWQDAEGNSYTAGKVITINKDLTLKAQWEQNSKEVKLIYDPIIAEPYKGYLNDSLNKSAEIYKIYEPNTSVTAKLTEAIPTSEAYYFVGWSLEKNPESDKKITAPLTLSADKTVYALWTDEVYVTYDADGVLIDGASSKLTIKEQYAKAYSLPEPADSKLYCSFGGWYTEKEGGDKVEKGTKIEKGEAHTLYAHWDSIEVSVTYNANGGIVNPTNKTVTVGSTYGTLPTPTKTGYTFDGWYTKANGGNKVISSTTVTNKSNHSIYAHWTANTYTVTFDVDEALYDDYYIYDWENIEWIEDLDGYTLKNVKFDTEIELPVLIHNTYDSTMESYGWANKKSIDNIVVASKSRVGVVTATVDENFIEGADENNTICLYPVFKFTVIYKHCFPGEECYDCINKMSGAYCDYCGINWGDGVIGVSELYSVSSNTVSYSIWNGDYDGSRDDVCDHYTNFGYADNVTWIGPVDSWVVYDIDKELCGKYSAEAEKVLFRNGTYLCVNGKAGDVVETNDPYLDDPCIVNFYKNGSIEKSVIRYIGGDIGAINFINESHIYNFYDCNGNCVAYAGNGSCEEYTPLTSDMIKTSEYEGSTKYWVIEITME